MWERDKTCQRLQCYRLECYRLGCQRLGCQRLGCQRLQCQRLQCKCQRQPQWQAKGLCQRQMQQVLPAHRSTHMQNLQKCWRVRPLERRHVRGVLLKWLLKLRSFGTAHIFRELHLGQLFL